MIKYQRPPSPPSFTREARVLRRTADESVRRGRKPAVDDDLWGRYAPILADAQRGKCAYCERTLSTHYPPIEHVAPRNEVHGLPDDEGDWGVEAHAHLANIAPGHRRKSIRISDWGYWARAYVWSNFVLACQACNTWKSTIYPLAKRPAGGWRPGRSTTRRGDELLLDCFDEPAPWRDHFTFDAITGAIGWKTVRGRATVGTCGLHRQSLQIERRELLEHVCELCRRTTQPSGGVHDAAWKDLARLGRDPMCFAGAVRAVAEARLGLTWDEVVAYAATLPR